MNTEIGNELTKKGISLRPAYGSTETGFMNIILPERPMGDDWEYFEFSDHVRPAFLDNGSDQHELLLLVGQRSFHFILAPSITLLCSLALLTLLVTSIQLGKARRRTLPTIFWSGIQQSPTFGRSTVVPMTRLC